MPEDRTQQMHIRLNLRELRRYTRAAKASGMTRSDWARKHLDAASAKQLSRKAKKNGSKKKAK